MKKLLLPILCLSLWLASPAPAAAAAPPFLSLAADSAAAPASSAWPHLALYDVETPIAHGDVVVVQGQTVVVNPTAVSFAPSPDHDVVLLDGRAVLDRYDLRIYCGTDTTNPVSIAALGKPTPVAGLIDIANAPALFSGAPKNIVCIGRVVAIGPGGTSPESADSNPFGLQDAAIGPPRPVPGAPTVAKR